MATTTATDRDAADGRDAWRGVAQRGIGPCYASKANRNGLRFADLLDGDAALETK